ncbi:MAG: hypothetical protein BGO12_11840 [Verrucomicrobia bacterium 61-8]|nr:hypothetical protein [Verrucomicrobiota bacterium]OJV06756.1 MAG: hypothetical protein BGO12_11840 [Verrucomicrobia bacterium 61-8]
MESVKSAAEWDEALSRLLSFLAALHIGGVEHRVRIAVDIMDEARRKHSENPTMAPVEHTMNITLDRLDEWFGRAFANIDVPVGKRVATGVVGIRVTDAVSRWPTAVLDDGPVPDELKATLARVSFRTGPDLAVSSMTPRPMDFGAMETIAQETWHRFAWAPLLRAAVLWTAIFFAALYAYDQFFAS